MSIQRKMHTRRFFDILFILTFAFLLSACPIFTRCEMPAQKQNIETWLDSAIPCLLKKYKVPGAALAIIRDGELVFSKGWGVQRAGESFPINEQTVFPAASLTKPVFAYGALVLVRDGRLDLDRSLSDYLEEPYIQGDDRLQKITARMVLSHTTGFPNWRPGFWTGSPKPLKIQFEPGSKFRYSGEGYNYLQLVVENITGKQLNNYMRDAVLNPLGMHDSRFVWDEAFESKIAIPHNRWGRAVDKWYWQPEKPMGAATLFTTIKDYARFLSAMLLTADSYKNTGNPNRKLSPKYLEKMLQPQIKRDNPLAWSLGWGLEEHKNDLFFWQWGDNPGIKHFAAGSRSRKVAVVVFTNGQNGQKVCRPIIETILHTKFSAFDHI
jgi:CubicO group peptidase (beta-lactamase class C family)